MKNFKTYFRKLVSALFMIILLLASIACDKDLLETVPTTSISSSNAFDTPERIDAQVNALYLSVKSSQFYGGRYTIYQELRGDEFILNKPNVQTGQLTWSHTVNSSTSEVQNLWGNAYASINLIHIFMEGLELNKAKISSELYTHFMAEGKFLRALSYLALVQQYARPYIEDKGASPGLPLRLKAELSVQNNALARVSVAEIYNQILQDLNDAETGLPLTYANAATNTTRAHQNTAIALKTRVYLIQGEYAKVMSEAAKIVPLQAPFQAATGVGHKLEATITDVFLGTYTGNEAIFSLPMSSLDAPGGQNSLAYYFTFNPGNAEYFLNVNGTVSDPVFSSTSTDQRKNLVVIQQGLPWLYKFKVASTYADYIPVIRYAETLLNYAEAAAQTGNLDLATDLLNAVRQRSDPAYNFPSEKIALQGALITTILEERKIELLGEGFRVPDLQRTLQPLPAKAGPAASSPEVAPSESKYIWPISAAELSTNELMVPNP
ncbi:putative outer membrane starch-binding protein [Dyadobacter jejuensis]|uniref:Putative outer membrane starch-binding protein n=1 Tax=Dyadobacter jejuensis TaxID=1082580 RepID=A0A316AEW8_9BACT|nr:RagB/SusD family nutrient uptake outer membrane protein [Dyadobacter jejuensis]PWJ55909.1 putative outer membrane starch-binding protein [Dyadobacter jejuensis]